MPQSSKTSSSNSFTRRPAPSSKRAKHNHQREEPVVGTAYDRASSFWGRRPEVTVRIYDYVFSDLELCAIPVPFLRASGDNSWSYVYHLLGCMLEGIDGGVIVDQNGNEYLATCREAPLANEYKFKNAGQWIIIECRQVFGRRI